MEPFDFPCAICSTPAKPDRINGLCHSCRKNTCSSCSRRCDRCRRTFCENHVEERTVMIQQSAQSKLLCDMCRRVLLV